MKIFTTCLRALDSLMTYELLASNINAHCVHILLATRVHLTRGAHEEFVYIKLFHTYLPSNVTSKSHFLKIVLIRLFPLEEFHKSVFKYQLDLGDSDIFSIHDSVGVYYS